eukprot:gene47471-biopygen31643
MCQAIINVANSSNPSSQLMETLVNTLLVSYSPTEVVTPAGTAICQQALADIAQFAKEGLLQGTASTTTSFLEPIVVVSPNIRMSALRNAVSSLLLSSISPPATASETAYGALLPKFTFSDLDISACDTGGGYVQMNVMTWGSNPFPGVSNVTTPLLRMDATSSGSRRRLQSHTTTSRTETLNKPPAYFITLQFNEAHNFNFSLDPNSPLPFGSNETFPECRMYNGFTYVPCTGCNISTYNNHNVTYGCGSIDELCGGNSGRRLNAMSDIESETTEYFQHMTEGLFANRRLQTISGDDDGTATKTGAASVSQFGAILSDLKAELTGVLTSFNPFAINVKKAAPILSVVGMLVFVMFGGMLYFARWDRMDHNELIYAQAD